MGVIPARGGSKGLSRKNIRPLAGKPLVAHTILQAKACPLIDRLVVSTDDSEIAEVAARYGAEVPFLRPAELATDNATTDAVLQHAVTTLEAMGYSADIVVWLHPTLVFRKPEWITSAVQNLRESPEVESSFVVVATHKHYWVKQDDQYVRLSLTGHPPQYTQRQKIPPVFREECGIACATRASIVKQGRRVGTIVKPVEVYEEITALDIHTEFDLWLAEKILTEWPGPIFVH